MSLHLCHAFWRMAANKKRSYNNADLGSPTVAALKKKSKVLSNLHLRVGLKKIELPAEAFLLLTESGHGFLSVQPIIAVLQSKADGSYEAVVPKEAQTAVAALKSYRPQRAKRKSGREAVEVPVELQKLLNALPKGFKLGVSADGKYRMVKTRSRSKK